jgi:hypothetical protein
VKSEPSAKTVGLFPEEVYLHYIDKDLVISTTADGPIIVLRNGSRRSLTYALKLTNFSLKKGGSWLRRPDGLSYHQLESGLQ